MNLTDDDRIVTRMAIKQLLIVTLLTWSTVVLSDVVYEHDITLSSDTDEYEIFTIPVEGFQLEMQLNKDAYEDAKTDYDTCCTDAEDNPYYWSTNATEFFAEFSSAYFFRINGWTYPVVPGQVHELKEKDSERDYRQFVRDMWKVNVDSD